MPSKTIDELLINLCWVVDTKGTDDVNRTKQQLLQDLTEMSESGVIFPDSIEVNPGGVLGKPVVYVPLSRLKQYLNIEGDDEKAKE